MIVDLDQIESISGSFTASFFSLSDVSASQVNGDLFKYDSGSGKIINFTPGYTVNTIDNGLVDGGIVTWLYGYTFNVSPAIYYINGVLYTSPSTNITLTDSDTVFDRIDIFAVTTGSSAIVITGVPAVNPEKPDADPLAQLEISFAIVNANTTFPSYVNYQVIYAENNLSYEWSGSLNNNRIVLDSTVSPFSGSYSIEATNVQANDQVIFAAPGAPNVSNYNVLTFQIKLKPNWLGNYINFLFFRGSTSVGDVINLNSNSYGLVYSNTSSYQTINIPLSNFGNIFDANRLRIRKFGISSGSGFFIDNIFLMSTTASNSTSNIILTGDVLGSGTDIIPTVLKNSGVVSGTYPFAKITVDSKGIITTASISDTGSFVLTASFNTISASFDQRINNITASGGTIDSSSFATTGSNIFIGTEIITGSLIVTGSVQATSFTGSLYGTASWAVSSSVADFSETASVAPYYLLTASFLQDSASFNQRIADVYISESNYTLTSSFQNYTASVNSFTSSVLQTLSDIITHTSSFATTGSNIFRGEQTITGSIFILGSGAFTGRVIGAEAINNNEFVTKNQVNTANASSKIFLYMSFS